MYKIKLFLNVNVNLVTGVIPLLVNYPSKVRSKLVKLWGLPKGFRALPARCQFHQYFTSSFFVWKFFCAAFMCLQCGFKIFWWKDFGAIATHKMLVKLTPGVSIRILLASAKANRRESKSCLCWVFNFKLGRLVIYAIAQHMQACPSLEL